MHVGDLGNLADVQAVNQESNDGDIAVLTSGLHVFRGRKSDFHDQHEFVPLEKSDLVRRPDLAAVQKVGLYRAMSHGGFIEAITIHPKGRISVAVPKHRFSFKTVEAVHVH